ncbi:c-type cytochrome [Magnetospirillum sp. UT-4]|uniref:c-type cytochrome n=1 Tax=Magnetospirillum sp. UT-4 TaxID=2681467 RepID=UPI00137F8ACB|nr:c-type cytochrome [Magnetospirillum sp. UT-4]CAA7612893.1 putative cytochrome c, class I [Magnetospirillum sp. UT-4]
MRRTLVILGLLVALGAVGALLFAWSGLYNVAASVPHWPPTRWLIEFGLENSVETHARGIEVPPLDDPALVHAGLGHYEGACQPCHGAPGQPPNPLVRRMLPEPPYLPGQELRWSPAQLFWIVRHGLKYTGMPAWVAEHRDDEIWAMVAALLRLPELDDAGYRRLLASGARMPAGESARLLAAVGPAGEALVACARCHGLTGAGGGAGAFPALAGQSREYLMASLKAYALGTRASGFMQPVAGALDDEQMGRLADHYAAMPTPPVRPAPNAATERGRAIAERGLPERGIPACVTCHGGNALARNRLFPRLDGQHAFYLAQQLRLFAVGTRGGTAFAELMQATTHGLDEAEIRAVAAYYAARGRPR